MSSLHNGKDWGWSLPKYEFKLIKKLYGNAQHRDLGKSFNSSTKPGSSVMNIWRRQTKLQLSMPFWPLLKKLVDSDEARLAIL